MDILCSAAIILDNRDAAPHIGHVAPQQWPLAPGNAALNEKRTRTMAKTTKTTDKVTDTADTAVKNGTAAFKNGFEKAAKGYDHFLTYGKDTAEAYLKSANAAGKGLETLHQEIYGFSKQSIEDSLAATKAVLGSK